MRAHIIPAHTDSLQKYCFFPTYTKKSAEFCQKPALFSLNAKRYPRWLTHSRCQIFLGRKGHFPKINLFTALAAIAIATDVGYNPTEFFHKFIE